jgi:dTDP-4-amino-4,6-dideoxygalactose transaminase
MLRAISRYGARVIPNTQQLIADMVRRDQFIDGPHIAQFESAFAARLGPVHATATSYGRMAFFYILKAMNLPEGGEIVMPALTFWVVPEIARVAGLRPVFVDVDPVTFNMTPEAFERTITPRTVAVVPTHLWGLPCDMDEIAAIARRHHIRVIEDCAHAFGATYRGRPAGTLGDAAFFSFQMIKPLNTYGGGMAVTNDPQLSARIAELAANEPAPDRSIVKNRLWHGRVQRIATRPRIFTWTLFPAVYACARMNWNLDMYFWEPIRTLDPLPRDYHQRYSNVQAAIGLESLRHVDGWADRTAAHAAQMTAELRGVPGVRVPHVPPDRTHAFYQYCAYVPSRDAVVSRCLNRGVDLETLHVDVCPDLDVFRGLAHAVPQGARQASETIQIPVYESLTDAEVALVGEVVAEAAQAQMRAATTVVRES